jgi:hypothetical protein
MRIATGAPALLCALLFGVGCTGSDDVQSLLTHRGGSVAFALDFAPLQAVSPYAITAATATLSRTGQTSVVKTLAVANGVAAGQVDGLAPGYWHVSVDVYDGATRIYTGATDVNVVAGVTVQCQILFDPVETPPTTGSVAITVGLNPMPGYTVLNQTASQILFDRASATLYIPDGVSTTIGVYDANTLTRTKDLAAPAPPAFAALNRTGTGIYLGYASGRIHLVDVSTGATTLVGDALMQIGGMVALDGNFLMVSSSGAYYSDTSLKVMDVTTGQIVSTRAPWYSLGELLYNPNAKTVYAHHQGVSPTDIHYVKVDTSTGAMTADGDSIYHGDYSFGPPLRRINGGTRLATSSGAMFTSAELVANDLRYSGSLGTTYADLSADDTLGKLYLLSGTALPKLLVIDQGTYFVERTVDLAGTPTRVFDTASSVIVFATKDGKTFVKAFPKAALGL